MSDIKPQSDVAERELSDRDLEAVHAGKGLGGPIIESYHDLPPGSPSRMWARFLDNQSIKLVGA